MSILFGDVSGERQMPHRYCNHSDLWLMIVVGMATPLVAKDKSDSLEQQA
ncbi:MAG TPA: hypothetical protein ACFE0H_11465 [Elainellaceae cyanobacterium]